MKRVPKINDSYAYMPEDAVHYVVLLGYNPAFEVIEPIGVGRRVGGGWGAVRLCCRKIPSSTHLQAYRCRRERLSSKRSYSHFCNADHIVKDENLNRRDGGQSGVVGKKMRCSGLHCRGDLDGVRCSNIMA
jgi:hypothetical protein